MVRNMNLTTYSVMVDQLERERDEARSSAAGYADIGDTEGSIYEDGVVAGLSRALDIVRNHHGSAGRWL